MEAPLTDIGKWPVLEALSKKLRVILDISHVSLGVVGSLTLKWSITRVLSHLHGDHAGGLKDLVTEAPHIPIYVSREHWEAFGKHPFYAGIQGCTPQHWPQDFAPNILEYSDHAVGPWKQSYNITSDQRVVVVDTPGHVPGHISLVVYGDNDDGTRTVYFLTGDATYGLDLLETEEPDGINDDPEMALQSLELIKEFARQTDLVVLPSHDVDTPRLLRERVAYKQNTQQAPATQVSSAMG